MFQFGGRPASFVHRSLQERLEHKIVDDGETDDKKEGRVSFKEFGPEDDDILRDGVYYEHELEEYKESYFKKCSRHKKCEFCSELTRYITKRSQVRTCENCMIEQMVLDSPGV
jgi:hypothetical protein